MKMDVNRNYLRISNPKEIISKTSNINSLYDIKDIILSLKDEGYNKDGIIDTSKKAKTPINTDMSFNCINQKPGVALLGKTQKEGKFIENIDYAVFPWKIYYPLNKNTDGIYKKDKSATPEVVKLINDTNIKDLPKSLINSLFKKKLIVDRSIASQYYYNDINYDKNNKKINQSKNLLPSNFTTINFESLYNNTKITSNNSWASHIMGNGSISLEKIKDELDATVTYENIDIPSTGKYSLSFFIKIDKKLLTKAEIDLGDIHVNLINLLNNNNISLSNFNRKMENSWTYLYLSDGVLLEKSTYKLEFTIPGNTQATISSYSRMYPNKIYLSNILLEQDIDPSPYDFRIVNENVEFCSPNLFTFSYTPTTKSKDPKEVPGNVSWALIYKRKFHIGNHIGNQEQNTLKNLHIDSLGQYFWGYYMGNPIHGKFNYDENTKEISIPSEILNKGPGNASNLDDHWETVIIYPNEENGLSYLNFEIMNPYSPNEEKFRIEITEKTENIFDLSNYLLNTIGKNIKYNLQLGGYMSNKGNMEFNTFNGYYKNLYYCSLNDLIKYKKNLFSINTSDENTLKLYAENIEEV